MAAMAATVFSYLIGTALFSRRPTLSALPLERLPPRANREALDRIAGALLRIPGAVQLWQAKAWDRWPTTFCREPGLTSLPSWPRCRGRQSCSRQRSTPHGPACSQPALDGHVLRELGELSGHVLVWPHWVCGAQACRRTSVATLAVAVATCCSYLPTLTQAGGRFEGLCSEAQQPAAAPSCAAAWRMPAAAQHASEMVSLTIGFGSARRSLRPEQPQKRAQWPA